MLHLEVSAQTLTAPPLPGWQPIRSCRGDLNGDGLDDQVVVYRATDAAKRVPTSLPFYDEMELVDEPGRTRFMVDLNPRKLVVYLHRPEGLVALTTASLLVPASTVTEGEHLDQLAIEQGELNLGLLYMHRRHGEVVHRILYRFSWNGRELELNHLLTTKFDRYIDRQERHCHYDLGRGLVSCEGLQIEDRTVLSGEQARISKQAPGLSELTPEWRPRIVPGAED